MCGIRRRAYTEAAVIVLGEIFVRGTIIFHGFVGTFEVGVDRRSEEEEDGRKVSQGVSMGYFARE